MTWVGLERYGYLEDAQRLAYRWLYMMTTAFVDFNGVVPEKFDAVKLSHLVDAEYGNQGIDFKMVPREGFGWMNSAYQVGLSFLSTGMRRAVSACTSPETPLVSQWRTSAYPLPSCPYYLSHVLIIVAPNVLPLVANSPIVQ
ncbi:hypothetical protein A0H81_08067 [Grifola frondosa]|uniref:alpha,alpha-trehalase n=1 Tax=Grifola frondosa TaxID=5627 RepID=A0A1C7MCE0_GRIFR|nr:hypothetical protein A0H81_08067 [Grifola frondosa]